MDRAQAIARLPEVHARALKLADQGVSGDELAHLLGVEPEAVRPLLEVAVAKLHALVVVDDQGSVLIELDQTGEDR